MNNKELKKLYEELIPYGYDTALETCAGGYPDKNDCTWYHSSWMLFRYLGMVSNPYWHSEFYEKAMIELKSNSKKNILIAGTADFSMPLFCHEIGIDKLDICDICHTPLLICNKVAELLKCNWTTYIQDICQENSHKYDAILNDAFLSRFVDKRIPLRGITHSLESHGYYITTLKIGKWNSGGEVPDTIKSSFINKAVTRYEQVRELLPNVAIKNVAKTYVDRMASYPVANEKEVYMLFSEAGLNILSLEKGNVEGEFEESEYFRIISQKSS